MANVKITDLAAYTNPDSTDVLPIVDVGADVTKKISIADLLENAGSGTAAAPGIAFDGDSNTGIYRPGADQLAISTNGTERVEFGTGEVVFNDGGENYDFRIEGDTEPNLVFIDASTNRVGLGTSSPASQLDIRGSATDFDGLRVLNTQLSSGIQTSSAIRLGITNSFGAVNGIRNCRIEAVESSTDSNNIHLDFYTNTAIGLDGETVKMRIQGDGKVGINTTSPSYTLDVNGPIRSSGTSGGLYFGGNSTTPAVGVAIHRPAADTLAFVTASTERARIDNSGRLLVGTSSQSGGSLLQVNDDRIRIASSKTPASASDTGTAGEICWDSSYIYVCTATDTWKRAALSTW